MSDLVQIYSNSPTAVIVKNVLPVSANGTTWYNVNFTSLTPASVVFTPAILPIANQAIPAISYNFTFGFVSAFP